MRTFAALLFGVVFATCLAGPLESEEVPPEEGLQQVGLFH